MKFVDAPSALGNMQAALHSLIGSYPAESMLVAAIITGILCWRLAEDWL